MATPILKAPPADGSSADRGMPSLAGKRGAGSTGAAIRGVLIGVAAVVLIVVVLVAVANKIKKRRQAESAQESAEQNAPSRAKIPSLPSDAFAHASSAPPLPASIAPSAPQPAVAQPGAPALPMTKEQQQAAAQRAAEKAQREAQTADSELVVFNSGAGGTGAAVSRATDPASSLTDQVTSLIRAQQPQQDKGPPAGSLAASLTPTSTSEVQASVLSNPSMTATKGTVVPCVLETAIDSTVPGSVSCRLTDNLYSTDGRVLLAERYSRVSGQYESASLKSGMSRIFILWTRLETPYHVVVDLDSPAADALGRGGLSGRINNHFWQRFGAGLLLSVVDDLTASAMKQSGSQTVQFTSTANSGNQAAQVALEHSVDIPPTLTKNQGGLVSIYLARDLNFGNVYALRSTH